MTPPKRMPQRCGHVPSEPWRAEIHLMGHMPPLNDGDSARDSRPLRQQCPKQQTITSSILTAVFAVGTAGWFCMASLGTIAGAAVSGLSGQPAWACLYVIGGPSQNRRLGEE